MRSKNSQQSASPPKNNFASCYHAQLQIQLNEKSKIKFKSKGIIPQELVDENLEIIKGLPKGRRKYLAEQSAKLGVKDEDNLYLQTLKEDELKFE